MYFRVTNINKASEQSMSSSIWIPKARKNDRLQCHMYLKFQEAFHERYSGNVNLDLLYFKESDSIYHLIIGIFQSFNEKLATKLFNCQYIYSYSFFNPYAIDSFECYIFVRVAGGFHDDDLYLIDFRHNFKIHSIYNLFNSLPIEQNTKQKIQIFGN